MNMTLLKGLNLKELENEIAELKEDLEEETGMGIGDIGDLMSRKGKNGEYTQKEEQLISFGYLSGLLEAYDIMIED